MTEGAKLAPANQQQSWVRGKWSKENGKVGYFIG